MAKSFLQQFKHECVRYLHWEDISDKPDMYFAFLLGKGLHKSDAAQIAYTLTTEQFAELSSFDAEE